MSMETKLTLTPSTPRPLLDKLIERTRNHKMTPKETRAQKRSYVIGEFMIEHPDMTREEVVIIFRKVSPELFED